MRMRDRQIFSNQIFSDKSILDYMRKFLLENDQMPPMQTIADHFGVYPNAINERMQKLEQAGFLQRNAVNKLMFSRNNPL